MIKETFPAMLPSVLIVEDDEMTRKTLAVILEAKRYKVTCASSIDQALAVLRNKCFDVVIMATKLLNKDDLRLHRRLDEIKPKIIKIVITTHPSTLSGSQALTLEADAYILKPIDPEGLLKTIRDKLSDRLTPSVEEDAKGNAQLVKSPNMADFRKYLEHMAEELGAFGLTANQAKVYITLVAVEPASASELSTFSGIRREEVYRLLPVLVEMGMVTKQLGSPLRYSAVPPENAIHQLMKFKIEKATEEMNSLTKKRDMLVTHLKKLDHSTDEAPKSIESITRVESFFERFLRSNQKACSQIDAIMSAEFLQFAQVNIGYMFKEFRTRGVKCRIITDESILPSNADWFAKMTGDSDFLELSATQTLGLRFINELPFNAVIVDGKEAIWGKFDLKDDRCNLWTNYPFHVEIVETAFEALWKNSKPFTETISLREKT